MDAILRSKYVEYIANALRFSEKETGAKWPEDTIIVAKSVSSLAETDALMGMQVFVMDMPSSYDFFVAFPSRHVHSYKLQKAFNDYQEMYPFSTEA